MASNNPPTITSRKQLNPFSIFSTDTTTKNDVHRVTNSIAVDTKTMKDYTDILFFTQIFTIGLVKTQYFLEIDHFFLIFQTIP